MKNSIKIFLINPDYLIYPFPPLGLAYLAAYVEKYLPHVEIKILDQLPEEKIIEKIKNEHPDIIGFSSTSSHHWKVAELARKVRSVCNSILVLGGIHITNYPKTFEKSPFDIGVLGEGEITFKKFIESFEKNKGININELKEIRGFVLRDKKKIINTGLGERINNLDDVPPPARHLLNMAYYTLPSFSNRASFDSCGVITTSRGCPYRCNYCSSSKFWGNCIKFFSAERVAYEIELLYKKYGYKIIQIYDDLFSINTTRLKEIIRLLREKGVLGKVEFIGFGRGNCINEEIVLLLKELNVKRLSFGVETGSKKMLNYLKDRITLEDDIRAIGLCRKHGIIPDGAFMIGIPYETREDMEETYQFIKKYLPNDFFIGMMWPFPNTPIWDYAIKHRMVDEGMYETKGRRFLEFDENKLLTLDATKEDLKEYFYKINLLDNKKIGMGTILRKLCTFRIRHVLKMMNVIFIKKLYNLGVRKVKQG